MLLPVVKKIDGIPAESNNEAELKVPSLPLAPGTKHPRAGRRGQRPRDRQKQALVPI